MAEYGDTQATLSAAMGLSLSRFNAKVNERNGATFTQAEITFIVERYHISSQKATAIFFPAFMASSFGRDWLVIKDKCEFTDSQTCQILFCV